MGYDKKLVVQYCYYEMLSSYFNNYTVANELVEKALYMHFRESGQDFQYQCEDYAIYSIENELPALINNTDLGKLDAKIRLSRDENRIRVDAGSVKFDVVCGYLKDGPKIFYENVNITSQNSKKNKK